MNKFLALAYSWFFLLSGLAHSAQIEGFPEECQEANDREPLEGHVIQLGQITSSNNGWTFSFPDKNDNMNLQQIEIAENAGLIGPGPQTDFANPIQSPTEPGSFVAAQVFVGDEDMEPIVTCLSRPMPLTEYVPDNYGISYAWLTRDIFIERISFRRYAPWNWRHWWRNDFDRIRRHYRKYRRDHDHWHKKDKYGRDSKKRNKKGDQDNLKPKRKDGERRSGTKPKYKPNKPKDRSKKPPNKSITATNPKLAKKWAENKAHLARKLKNQLIKETKPPGKIAESNFTY